MIAGVLSIGTNSTRALVAEIDDKAHVILARSTGTRIGEGLKETGVLQPAAVKRTLEALRDHMEAVRAHTCDVCAIATSALRRAQNAEAFANEIARLTGAQLEILSGEEEARRSYVGAVSGLSRGKAYAVVDIGGGSTEIAVGRHDAATAAVSCEIGAVRLTEAVPALGGSSGPISNDLILRARAIAARALQGGIAGVEAADETIVVGGTANTLVRIVRGSMSGFSYATLTREQLLATMDLLQRTPLETRKTLAGMNPQRSDILLAGAIILDEVLALRNVSEVLVTPNDLLLGTLLLRER